MAKTLSILFVSSEVCPFVKVGGIADVTFSLPLAIRDIGHDIRVMIPKYGCVSERKNRIHEINRLRDVAIPIGNSEELATIKSSSINNPRVKVQAYITTNTKYFDSKKGVYDNIKNNKPYSDNDERFLFFNRSVIETCLLLGWFPDIIHCNDWQAALIPAYARLMHPGKFKKTKFVFTIHNISQQGVFPESTFQKLSMPNEVKDNFIHKKNFNFLKAGLVYSDYLTTVSPSYAEEILNDNKLSNGLNSIVQANAGKFEGILNSIDPWGWNPKTDINISKKYTTNFEDYKLTNKQAVLKKFKLEYKPETPLIAMINRIDEQKGIPLFIEAADKLLAEDIQIMMLGEGDADMKNKLTEIAKKYPKKFAVKFAFDEPLAHLMEAGSDIYLMPSLSEPCGLNAMYSILYGSIPIVHTTGGLKDIIIESGNDTKKGNGFVFKTYKAADMIKAVQKVLALYSKREEWNTYVQEVMKSSFSWKVSAAKYDEIYRSLLKEV